MQIKIYLHKTTRYVILIMPLFLVNLFTGLKNIVKQVGNLSFQIYNIDNINLHNIEINSVLR